ncbi:MAG: type II secretion system protein GspC [Steroidobacteraceae bacterium]
MLAVLQGFRPSDAPAAGFLARAPQIVAWVLVIAIGAQAAVIVGDLLSGPPKASVALSAPTPVALPLKQVDLSQIVGANLFGSPKLEAGADAGNAPATTMALVLTGVIAGDDPQRGLAILGPSAAAAKVIAVGDMVPGGAKLYSVYADRVLLDRNGTVESLMLPRQYAGAPASPAPPLSQADSGGAFNRVQRVIQEHPNIIGDVMSPQAVLAQGKLRGYRVYPGTNAQAFQKLGLRAGDLVTHINGTALDDPTRSSEILNTLSSASDARVTVMRSGRQQDLVLNLAQVAAEAERMSEPAGPASSPPPSMGDVAPPPRQD